jgi:uncharacterized protein
MKLDLSEIARIPGSYAEHTIDMVIDEVEGMTLTAPVQGMLNASSTGNVLLLEGAVDTMVEQVCSRCGIVFPHPIHAEFQEDFVVRPPQTAGQGPRLEEDDEAPETRLFIPDTLDLNLDELLRQSILVALPLKPLCQEDCQGLCPRCGQPLNEGPCPCPPAPGATPLGDLQRLLNERRHPQG